MAPLTILLILAVVAFALAIISFWRPTLTVAVLLLCIIELAEKLPGGIHK